MAQKRMFSKDVISNDNFVEMPDSSQNLYFHLSMNADDDGFVANYKSVMRMLGKKEDDLKVLLGKQFILPFENGLLVIRHWRLNNYIQKDRYKETIYKNEKAQLTIDNNNVYNLDTNCIHRLDKISIDKISIDKTTTTIYETLENNFNRTISPMEYEKIEEWLLSFNEDIITYAIELCVLQNKKTFAYLDGILKNWKSNSYKTLEEIKDNGKIKKDNVPDWFDKEIKANKMSVEEEEELKKGLEDFK